MGQIRLHPDLVNVIANEAVLTLDLRNTDETALRRAEQHMHDAVERLAAAEGVTVTRRSLARFEPVAFDPAIVERVEAAAREFGHSVMRLPSGAGHDAQMFAPNCPTGMIFVPSREGISHNIREFTDAAQIGAGADILLRLVLDLAGLEANRP